MAVNQLPLASAMAAAIAKVQAAVTAAGNLDAASLTELAPVKVALTSALPTVAAAVSALDADIPTATFAGMVAGNPVPALVLSLQTYTNEVQQLGLALYVQAYLSRLNANINAATG
jgi:hypothetical protein